MARKIETPTALLTIVLGLLPWTAEASIKCWTNREGVRECGNVIPPEYAQQETRTVNQQGVTVDVRGRARTREEIMEERQRQRAEEQRRAEEERQREAQANYDRVLMATFTSEGEIAASLERKLAAVEGTIELNEATLLKLEEKSNTYRKRSEEAERTGKGVPEELRQDMDGLQRQIDEKRAYIAAKRLEQDQLRQEYDGYLRRFRELTGRE